MAVTTTENIGKSDLLCGSCGGLVRGGLTVRNANGKFVGECCASPGDRELLEGLIGEAPEPERSVRPVAQASLGWAMTGDAGVLFRQMEGVRTLEPNPQLPVPSIDELIDAAPGGDEGADADGWRWETLPDGRRVRMRKAPAPLPVKAGAIAMPHPTWAAGVRIGQSRHPRRAGLARTSDF